MSDRPAVYRKPRLAAEEPKFAVPPPLPSRPASKPSIPPEAFANDDPPRRFYGFKRPEIVRVNPPPHMSAEEAQRPQDIPALLRENVAHDEKIAWRKELEDYEPPRSRRTRDYLIALIGGNLTLGGIVAVLPHNPAVLIFGLGGFVIFSVGLTWIMFFVMDDYT